MEKEKVKITESVCIQIIYAVAEGDYKAREAYQEAIKPNSFLSLLLVKENECFPTYADCINHLKQQYKKLNEKQQARTITARERDNMDWLRLTLWTIEADPRKEQPE